MNQLIKSQLLYQLSYRGKSVEFAGRNAASETRIFDLSIPMFYTVCMNESKTEIEQETRWQKTPVANLVRYSASGTYYARTRVKGKLI